MGYAKDSCRVLIQEDLEKVCDFMTLVRLATKKDFVMTAFFRRTSCPHKKLAYAEATIVYP